MFEFYKGTYGYIAMKDMDTADKSFTVKNWNACCFYCHQALEKLAKQYITLKAADSDSITPVRNILKSHKLKRLYAFIDTSLSDKYKGTLSDLTDMYYDCRYPNVDYMEADEKTCTQCFEETKLLLQEALNLFYSETEITIPETKEF